MLQGSGTSILAAGAGPGIERTVDPGGWRHDRRTTADMSLEENHVDAGPAEVRVRASRDLGLAPRTRSRETGRLGTRNPEVDAWFERYTNPQRELVQAVRAAVLDADDRITEAIKWQAPTFIYKGNIASFYPKTKTHASLMFHRGAELDDLDGLLEGEGDVSRVARFLDGEDLERKRAALQGLIRRWIQLRDGERR